MKVPIKDMFLAYYQGKHGDLYFSLEENIMHGIAEA